jgi:hypothetical protein
MTDTTINLSKNSVDNTTEKKSSVGIQTTGENINWKYLNEERVDDPIINTLIKEAIGLYIDKKIENKVLNNNELIVNTCIEYYLKYLKDINSGYKLKIILQTDKIDNSKQIKDKKKKHGVKQEVTKKDLMLQKIAEENLKKDMKSFVQSLTVNEEHMPYNNKKHIESFFVMLNWGIYL